MDISKLYIHLIIVIQYIGFFVGYIPYDEVSYRSLIYEAAPQIFDTSHLESQKGIFKNYL